MGSRNTRCRHEPKLAVVDDQSNFEGGVLSNVRKYNPPLKSSGQVKRKDRGQAQLLDVGIGE